MVLRILILGLTVVLVLPQIACNSATGRTSRIDQSQTALAEAEARLNRAGCEFDTDVTELLCLDPEDDRQMLTHQRKELGEFLRAIDGTMHENDLFGGNQLSASDELNLQKKRILVLDEIQVVENLLFPQLPH